MLLDGKIVGRRLLVSDININVSLACLLVFNINISLACLLVSACVKIKA
jgi:hypothetical protein